MRVSQGTCVSHPVKIRFPPAPSFRFVFVVLRLRDDPSSSDPLDGRPGQKELVEFIFNTCKLTAAGELEIGELDRLAKSFHLSNDAFWPVFSQQLEEINKSHHNGDLIMTLDFFLDMHHKFPMILYPALRAQVSSHFQVVFRTPQAVEHLPGSTGGTSPSLGMFV